MPGPSNRQIGLHLLLALILVGCGFQLKGTGGSSGDNSLNGVQIAVTTPQPRAELTVAVLQQLSLEQARVVDAGPNIPLLRLGNERFRQRNLSLTAQARSAEVELTMDVDIDLTLSGEALISGGNASVVQQFLNDPRNIVGKTEEMRLLREEMRRDLAAQIIRRVSQSLGN